jgi:hypothetical protein
MKASHMLIGMIVLATVSTAFGQNDPGRYLIARVAAEPQAVEASVSGGSGAQVADAELEQRARTDLQVAEARLELILARKALRNQQHSEAAERAQRALGLLRALPPGVDASAYELQAEGILARSQGAGTNGASLNGMTQAGAVNGAPESGTVLICDDDDDEEDDDCDDDNLDTPEYRYYRAQLAHQGRVREALAATEVRELTAVDELRVVPPGDVFYPVDWMERMARRSQYADGAIARSPTWTGQDGQEWQVVIYDVSDITYVTPDFQVPGGFGLVENLYNALDRDALRQHSQIFSGYAEDLAAGIPLLNYFGGGIDPLLLRGPKYSIERQEQIVQMINAVLDRTEKPTVISLPPRP